MEKTPIVTLSAGLSGEHLDRVHETVQAHLERAGIAGTSNYALRSVVDELVCNVLEHGSALWMELEIHPAEGDLAILLRDNGAAFDPLPYILSSGPIAFSDEQDSRNLGLYLVGKLAGQWRYKRLDNGVNQLEAVIPLTPEEGLRWSDHRGVRLLILVTDTVGPEI